MNEPFGHQRRLQPSSAAAILLAALAAAPAQAADAHAASARGPATGTGANQQAEPAAATPAALLHGEQAAGARPDGPAARAAEAAHASGAVHTAVDAPVLRPDHAGDSAAPAGAARADVEFGGGEALTTGRFIVHLVHDGAANRAELAAMGAARRARSAERVRELVAAREARLAPQRADVVASIESAGGHVLGSTWIANTVVFEGGAADLPARLAQRADVRLVQADRLHAAQLSVATDAQHHASDIANQFFAPNGLPVDGSGQVLALVDSGVDARHAGSNRPHAAFFVDGSPQNTSGPGIAGSRLLSATNSSAFFPLQSSEDVHGHGTRMASIAAGARFNTLPGVDDGPAHGAALRSYKISDDQFGGLASTFSMDLAFQKLLLDVDVGVANMSYDGSVGLLASPNPAIEAATLADVFVTLSAGNLGANLGFAHGCHNALVVGASRNSAKEPLAVPGFVTSAIGPLPGGRTYPHMLAVGEAITCARLDAENSSIESWGTSGASALVAGSAVLVRQAAPTASVLETKALLVAASDPVVLGPVGARGFGYLRTDRAVQNALAGLVVEETATTGIVKRHKRFLAAGEEATFALVWNRETPNDLTVDDLDLRVRAPFGPNGTGGAVLAWSASTVDTIEVVRITAPTSGVYEIQVVPIVFDGDGQCTYALAGVDSASIDPSACSPGAPVVLAQSPPAVPTLAQGFDVALPTVANHVVLTGCNFTGTSQVTLAGQPIGYQVVDANTLVLELPIPALVGAVPLRIVAPGGTLDHVLDVVPADDVLHVSPNIVSGHLGLWFGGTPGDLYVLAYSPALLPSIAPGILEADIGNQFTSLFVVGLGALPVTNGVVHFTFGNVPGTAGQQFHFQAVTLDPLTLQPPWNASNVATTIWTH